MFVLIPAMVSVGAPQVFRPDNPKAVPHRLSTKLLRATLRRNPTQFDAALRF